MAGDFTGPIALGYCTNVHAGADLETNKANLERHAVAVKAKFSPHAPMGVGLWLPSVTAQKLRQPGETERFADWLGERGLSPFTLNGFPYGDFHQPIVKHDVYLPTWFDPRRRDYTLDLIDILDGLLPAGEEGSISTSPIAWGDPTLTDAQWASATANLREVAARLARLEQESGRRIRLCLEPEPGCQLQYSRQMVDLFEQYLLPGGDEDAVRRYLGVCHDVCHAAVMFEGQTAVLQRYQAAGIGVGKVQISSAVCVDFDRISPTDRAEAVEQLRGFSEDRYLHQTVVQTDDGTETFFEDLPLALAQAGDPVELASRWRVHFHVPVYLEKFGLLSTSRNQIEECLVAARELTDCRHFEVETYAWGVLPPELQQAELADGIAAEMEYIEQAFKPIAP
ncbi:metabolite traffic protein EboE [Lignipirellula cremea]|uniref:Xylose isomerase-like TIM barrel n=1 Tax=Lignipirellula cremea TaxID=2528010 RepID=A0A518DWH2_9BACT|nr:metabolite traffic protein EboE [Lignipirellula cremea]QDU96186.1 hypothetical protein Pla8534_40050 [Lignipirellula cremea]